MELNNNNCGCGCGILVAEFEGIKLDLVILQKKFEIEFATERTNVSQLKRELAHEKDKNSRLESDLTLFVRERNAEVDELNETIALLKVIPQFCIAHFYCAHLITYNFIHYTYHLKIYIIL
jgi:hypothetical protein